MHIPTVPFEHDVHKYERNVFGRERTRTERIRTRAWILGEPPGGGRSWWLLIDGRLYQHGGSHLPFDRNPVAASEAFGDPYLWADPGTHTRQSLRAGMHYDGYVDEIVKVMAARIASFERYHV
jgi:hypothetical protein